MFSAKQIKLIELFYMVKKAEIGKLGEDLACEYLVKNRYRVLERNYRKPWGEIDVIGRSPDRTLVFFEVKTVQERTTTGLMAEDNLTQAKLKKLQRTCTLYAGRYPDQIDEEKGWRIDLLALTINEKDCDIKHYKNITLD